MDDIEKRNVRQSIFVLQICVLASLIYFFDNKLYLLDQLSSYLCSGLSFVVSHSESHGSDGFVIEL
jgi:hypothetical protein